METWLSRIGTRLKFRDSPYRAALVCRREGVCAEGDGFPRRLPDGTGHCGASGSRKETFPQRGGLRFRSRDRATISEDSASREGDFSAVEGTSPLAAGLCLSCRSGVLSERDGCFPNGT